MAEKQRMVNEQHGASMQALAAQFAQGRGRHRGTDNGNGGVARDLGKLDGTEIF